MTVSKILGTILGLLVAPVILTGCQPNISPNSYALGSVGQVNRTVRGIVVSARPVAISGTQSGLGAGAGAVAGGAAGSTIGNGGGGTVAAVVGGALIGGMIGAAAEESATHQNGYEYVVETENGALLTVVQGNDVVFTEKQHVLVIYGSRARIVADNAR